ncbi:hypothetical protein TcG_08596, partial [Trypanosoma cruzi]
RKRPQPSHVANNGSCVKEKHEPRKGRLCSCRVATRSIVAVNRWFSPPQPRKTLSIRRLLLWTKRPRLFSLPSLIVRHRLESSVSLRALYQKRMEGKGTARKVSQTCMSLSKVVGFNRLWVHSRFNTGTSNCCFSGMVRSSCGVAKRVLVTRLVIVAE